MMPSWCERRRAECLDYSRGAGVLKLDRVAVIGSPGGVAWGCVGGGWEKDCGPECLWCTGFSALLVAP